MPPPRKNEIGAAKLQRAVKRGLKAHANRRIHSGQLADCWIDHARERLVDRSAVDTAQVREEFVFGVGAGQVLAGCCVQAAEVARVPAVSAAEVARRALEDDDAGAGFARGERRAQARHCRRQAPRRRSPESSFTPTCASCASARAGTATNRPPTAAASSRADRTRDEDREIAFADRQRAAELLLRQRSEDQTDHRRRPAARRTTRIAQPTDADEIEHARSSSDRFRLYAPSDASTRMPPKSRRRGISMTRAQTPGERQVQHQQHHVADVEAGDERPDEVGTRREQQRARLQAVLLKRREHHRRRRGRRKTEREQRNQHAGGRRVVGGLGPGDAFDRAVPESLGLAAQPLLDHVGHERRNHRAAARQHAEWKADGRSAQPGLPRSLPVVAAHAVKSCSMTTSVSSRP